MYLAYLKKKVLSWNWTRVLLINVVQQGPIPKHIALIMDGNRRFAKTHNLSIERGHRLGGSALEKVLGACYLAGVKILTVYAFSTENFQRPRAQVDAIMHLLREQIARCSAPGGLAEQLGVAIRVLGRLDLLDDETRGAVMKAVDTTRGGNRLILNLCVAYSSRDEMTRAVRRSVEEYSHPRSPSHPETALTAQSLSDKMYTADNPPVDILVRSSGVYRLSDFLLWQCHQATHIQFLDTLWPDFGAWELFMVLLRWQRMRATTGRSRAGDAQAMVSCYISPGVCVLLALFSFFSAVSYYLAIV